MEIFKKARGNIAKTGTVAFLSMLLSLLVLLWITNSLAIPFYHAGYYFFAAMRFWPLFLLFVISAGLALALGKVSGVLIALPHFALFAEGLFGLMLFFLHRFRPALPAGFYFLFAAAVLPLFFVALLRNKNEGSKNKIYRVVLAIQMVVAVGTVYYYIYHYGVRHLKEIVSVHSIRLGNDQLGLPLVEGNVAYIVNGDGWLFQVDLEASHKRVLARIPLPKPVDVGMPELLLPRREKGLGRSPYLRDGVLTRGESRKLYYQYTYWLVKQVRFNTGVGYHDGGSWTIEVKINQESGEVSWELREFEAPAGTDPVTRLVEYGGLRLNPDYYISRPFTLLIEGEGVRTIIDPIGRVEWVRAEQGWILVGTNKGVLYIIAPDAR